MDADTQLGPLTTEKRLNEIEELVEKTKQEGAKVLLGGKRPLVLIKVFSMSQQYLIMLKMIILL